MAEKDQVKHHPICEFIRGFFDAYFLKRDLDTVLSFCSDEIMVSGYFKYDTDTDKDYLKKTLGFQMKYLSKDNTFDFVYSSLREISKDVYMVQGMLHVKSFDKKLEWETAISMVIAKEAMSYKIVMLHVTKPMIIDDTLEVNHVPSRDLLRLVLDEVPTGSIGIMATEGYPVFSINNKMLNILGFKNLAALEEKTQGNLLTLVFEEDRDDVKAFIKRCIQYGKSYEIEFRVISHEGRILWVRDACQRIRVDDGSFALLNIISDMTEHMHIRLDLVDQAQKDPLTKVLNRRGGQLYISHAVSLGRPYIFGLMDIDNFKQINDVYGHGSGDTLLCYIAYLLKSTFRESDIVMRLGGDEFIFLAFDTQNVNSIQKKVEQINMMYVDYVKEHFPKVHSALSFGCVLSQADVAFWSLYKEADETMYSIKRNPDIVCKITHRKEG